MKSQVNLSKVLSQIKKEKKELVNQIIKRRGGFRGRDKGNFKEIRHGNNFNQGRGNNFKPHNQGRGENNFGPTNRARGRGNTY